MMRMLRLLMLLAVAAAGWVALPCPAAEPAATPTVQPATPDAPVPHRRKRIAVVRFDVPDDIVASWSRNRQHSPVATDRLSAAVTDMLITALLKTGAVDVIERTELEKVLAEQKLSASGVLDPATAAKAGKVLGVDLLLGGKLLEFGVKEQQSGVLGALTRGAFGVGVDVRHSTARVRVDARVIDATSARILVAATGIGENREGGLLLSGTDFDNVLAAVRFDSKEWLDSRIGRATRQAVDQVVEAVRERFPVEAGVLGVLPTGDIILNLGRFSGITRGTRFELMREEILTDPQTGVELYRDHQSLGIIRVVEAQDDRCKCTPVTPLAAPARPGDYAVLLNPTSPKKK